ncbi:PREDICTED: uncharacterized protein LOC101365871 [Odobenus rosmarus divergens]|uniref:Uncharacterized protein LOC101365871 n=1 Tax=Odobenus rosmarus divergens TaxID=9708 RepID=A0A9B0LFB9_ODORO
MAAAVPGFVRSFCSSVHPRGGACARAVPDPGWRRPALSGVSPQPGGKQLTSRTHCTGGLKKERQLPTAHGACPQIEAGGQWDCICPNKKAQTWPGGQSCPCLSPEEGEWGSGLVGQLGSWDTWGAAASAPGLLVTHSGGPGLERPCSEAPPYVNIPVSPSSKTQLHYMGLELQGASAGIRGAGASRYAQIDIMATEAAHRVGAQHAQSREERLPELEQRRKGALR